MFNIIRIVWQREDCLKSEASNKLKNETFFSVQPEKCVYLFLLSLFTYQ